MESILNDDMNKKWGYIYYKVVQIRFNKKPCDMLYFDLKHWKQEQVNEFFTDLQVNDKETLQYFINI